MSTDLKQQSQPFSRPVLSRMCLYEKMVLGEYSRYHPLLLSQKKKLPPPYRRLYLGNIGQLYLADVRSYRSAQSVFSKSLRSLLFKYVLVIVLLLGVLFSLSHLMEQTGLHNDKVVKLAYWGLLGASCIYLILLGKVFPMRLLLTYISFLKLTDVEKNCQRLVEQLKSIYQAESGKRQAASRYYQRLEALRSLIDFEVVKTEQVKLLLAHLVDFDQHQELPSSSLLGEGYSRASLLYLSHLAQVNRDQIDRQACNYILSHLDKIENDFSERYGAGETLDLVLGCLPYYPQLSSEQKKRLRCFLAQSDWEKGLNPLEQAQFAAVLGEDWHEHV